MTQNMLTWSVHYLVTPVGYYQFALGRIIMPSVVALIKRLKSGTLVHGRPGIKFNCSFLKINFNNQIIYMSFKVYTYI